MNTKVDGGGKNDRATLSEVAGNLNLAAREKWQISDNRPFPPLLLLSDDTRLPDPAAALAALPAGSGFIFRHYNSSYREEIARSLHAQARSHGVVFLVAGDLDLALSLGADGCHMPEHRIADLKVCQTHPSLQFNTAAAHSADALEAAARNGADAALLSPVFATTSHPGGTALGAARAAELAGSAPLPVYALGGISAQTAPRLALSPFAGLAAIEGLSSPRG